MVLYIPGSNALYLMDDTGSGFVSGGPLMLDGAGSLQNSQCTLQATPATASVSGTSFLFGVNVTHKGAFPTSLNAYGIAFDSATNSGWETIGPVTIQ